MKNLFYVAVRIFLSWLIISLIGVIIFLITPKGMNVFVPVLKLFPIYLFQVILLILFVFVWGIKKGIIFYSILFTFIFLLSFKTNIELNDLIIYFFSANWFWYSFYGWINKLVYSDLLITLLEIIIFYLNMYLVFIMYKKISGNVSNDF